MTEVTIWILIYLLQGGSGENGPLKANVYLPSEESQCKAERLALTIDPDVLGVSECQRVVLSPTQVKKR